MMSKILVTKRGIILIESQTLQPGSSVSGTLDMSSSIGSSELMTKIINGNPAPQSPCYVTIERSIDGSNWFEYTSVHADNAPAEEYVFNIRIPEPTMYLKVTFEGNVSNQVTVEANIMEFQEIQLIESE